jgi:hypothetical protein
MIWPAAPAYADGSTDLVGDVYIYQNGAITAGVPDTDSDVHLIIPNGSNQSFKAASTLANTQYGFINMIYGSVNEKTSASVDIFLKVRQAGKVFREQLNFSASSTGGSTNTLYLDPYLIVPKNADIMLTAISDSPNTSVSAGYNMLYGIVQ